MSLSEAVKGYATPLAILVLAGVLVAMLDCPPPAPTIAEPTSPLAIAARDYARGLGSSLAQMGAKVKGREITDKEQAVEYRKATARPLADALDAAFAAHSDEGGTITDPQALGDLLIDAGRAAEAK